MNFIFFLPHFPRAHSIVLKWFRHLSVNVELALSYCISLLIPCFCRSSSSFRNVKNFFYFSYIPRRYRRSAKAWNKKYSYSRPRSNRPLAWFLRPLNYYFNKSLFRCVISIYCNLFGFVVAAKISSCFIRHFCD